MLSNLRRVRFGRLTGTLLNFILPPVCASCEKVGVILCADCLATFPKLREPWCLRCGRMVDQPTSRCASCRRNPLSLKQVRAVVQFADAVPGVIHKMKYKGMFALAEPLADLMANSWPPWEHDVDLVISIPLHPERQKHRGYNQSELLAGHIREQLDLPGAQAALRRVRHTRPQVDLSATERLTNVSGAFQANREMVEGKKIILIDDVCTTGSTLSEAARALLAEGAETVSGYCLARAV